MANKTHRTVVRNASYRSGEFNLRERHNERKNESYRNGDIDPARADMNIHFKQSVSPTGEPETYVQAFNRLLEEGKIVKRGLKPDAKVFDELVFDVNTAYFENNGGYEYAKSFFAEAYRLAVKEVGGEDYILSAVLHADERNKALSDELGQDVYHLHLHVVYVPIVQKEILWSRRTKDKSLVGKVKEVIPQISHSKKWPMRVPTERGDKTVIVNSYSLLQDRFYEHMRAAGFEGFERGERGSVTEHLDVLDYKIQQDRKTIADLSEQKQQLRTEADALVEATKVRAGIFARQEEINAMARPGKSGNTVFVSNADWKRVSEMAKRCILLDEKIKGAEKQINSLKVDRDTWKTNYERLWNETKDFIKAIRISPNRLREFIEGQRIDKSRNWEESR